MNAPQDYKATLNLPETPFPMQANLARREPEMLARWQQADLYAQVQADTAHLPAYVFVDGPPYANGDIHIGHAVNKVLKDMVVKSARLNGHQAPFVPGWDCHGLPIELQVEKKFGKVGDKLDAKAFREKCREYANEQVAKQREDFKRLGVLADWDKPYLTMQPAFEAEQLRCLAKIIERGHVVRGFKPVHWCLDCGSSLAEAEVEYEDKKSKSIYVRFRVNPVGGHLTGLSQQAATLNASLLIWTTTPWTLPANWAVSVHPGIEYSLIKCEANGRQEYLVIASELVGKVAQAIGFNAQQEIARCRGEQLYRMTALHPFADRVVPVIFGDHVTLDAGTGLVHTAPAHGQDDYVACKANANVWGALNLPPPDFVSPVGPNGIFIDGTPLVAGQHVRKADEPIIESLKVSGALAHLAEITHSYPHCWRHKTPLIFRATPQWFVAMDENGLRTSAVKAISETRWIPAWGENRIREMVAGRPDWCISRQRTWGVPMALFVQTSTDDLVDPDDYLEENISTGWSPLTAEEKLTLDKRKLNFSADVLRKIADAVETEGLNAWFESNPKRWLPQHLHDAFDQGGIAKVKDTLDVWFDSGVVHQCSFKSTNPAAIVNGVAPKADMYLEGSDQHRGWFQSSLLTSVAMQDRAPYKAVLTHGFTVDEQGRKMSKSLGNVVAPQQVIKTLGADVLRLWVAASDYSGEIAISDNLLKRIADAYRRIRNTARYLLASVSSFDPAQDTVPVGQMLAIDRWALSQAARLQDEIKQAYDESQFHLVYQKLHNYCVVDLGGLYLDVLKDRLYTLPAKSLARRSAQTALLHIAEAMVRWIAPILSFTADEIWQLLPGDRSGSVFAQQWHTLPAQTETDVDWPRLVAVRENVKKVLEDLRAKSSIGSGLNADVTLYADGAVAQALQDVGEELRFWFITSDAKVLQPTSRNESAVEAKLEPGETLWISAAVSTQVKCERCWHQRADVGTHAMHPTLCGRCVDNVAGAGETRRFI